MGCKLRPNRHGNLGFRLIFEGYRTWERTDLSDTQENRARLAARERLIDARIRAKQFTISDYLAFFPNGNLLRRVRSDSRVTDRGLFITVRMAFDAWMQAIQPPRIRLSQF